MTSAVASLEGNAVENRETSYQGDSASSSRLTRRQHAYILGFFCAVFLSWSPFNALGYLAPLVVLALYWLMVPSKTFLIRLLSFLGIWALVAMLHSLQSGFYWWSAIVWLVTYSVWLVAFLIPTRPLASTWLWRRMLHVAAWVVLFEAIWGLSQAAYGVLMTGQFAGSTGDYVEGTIHPALRAEMAFSNPMYAVNMTLLLIVLMPVVAYGRKWRVHFVLGLLALIAASVIHVLFLFGIAIGAGVLIYYPKLLLRKRGIILAIAVCFAVLMTAVAVDNGFERLQRLIELTRESSTSRSLVIQRVIQDMPQEYPYAPLFGLGPGQFSSRAGLITSGMFFGRPTDPRPLPVIGLGMSTYFEEYVLDLWLYGPRIANSSSTRPWFGWLSVYTEWGALGFLLCCTVLIYLLVRVRRSVRSRYDRVHATVFGAGALFIFLLGLQENYWEVAQALLVGIMLLKVLYANLTAQRNARPLATRVNNSSYSISPKGE